MEVIIDKKNYMTVTHSSGYVTDDNDVIYPFSVEVVDEDGEINMIVVWDDDVPENSEELDKDIKKLIEE